MTRYIYNLREEFFKDLKDLLDLHERFLEDPEGQNPDDDNWDFVLDKFQNIFVDWVLRKHLMFKENNDPMPN